MKAPFPYFGGKSKAAHHVWAGLGNVSHYIEPFAGSLAVLLARPHKVGPRGHRLTETVNDADGLLVNFWRSMVLDPDAVERHARWPVLELDLHARHAWLIGQRECIVERLRADPEWCDPKAAGWWVWGAGAWIGDGWGRAWSKGMPNIGDGGRGVHSFHGMERLRECAARMDAVRALCGDWRRACAPSGSSKWRNGTVGVFLDPPYGEGAVDYAAGGNDTGSIVADVWAWAATLATHEHVRICIAGYAGHPCIDGWRCHEWDTNEGARGAGYGNRTDGEARKNGKRERLWFSPTCIEPARQMALI